MATKKNIPLRYIGAGAALPDVPARDLSAAEAAAMEAQALIDSGLYEVQRAAQHGDVQPVAAEETK